LIRKIRPEEEDASRFPETITLLLRIAFLQQPGNGRQRGKNLRLDAVIKCIGQFSR
jgi:hypothetical protein